MFHYETAGLFHSETGCSFHAMMRKSKGKILVIDDDPDVLFTARMILRPYFAEVLTESSPKKLETLLRQESPELIILDMNFVPGATSGNEGLFWLRKIADLNPALPVIMNTAYGGVDLAVECMKEGAYDFLVKPWQKEKLLSTVSNVLELAASRRKIRRLDDTRKTISDDLATRQGDLVGESPAFENMLRLVHKVANTEANVLLLGENGTGKELVAREIHTLSSRKEESFISVDLGAISPGLFESELFGHEKGAFTDARESRAGRFEVADKGTLFLDEIGNISLEAQARLLTVLQNRQVIRVGSAVPVPVDIRLISATNKPVYEMVREKQFREDLIYRINTVEIHIPPLRDRQTDIPLLTSHFIDRFSRKYGRSLEIEEKALKKMAEYPWPGNVRELQHSIERAVIMAEGNVITEKDLFLREGVKNTKPASLNMEELEKSTISEAIDKHDGNLSEAARELGMGRTTLYRKLDKYGLKS